MRSILLALSLLSLGAFQVPQSFAADLSGWSGHRHWPERRYPVRLERQHPSTINGIELGNLLPEGPIYPPRSLWSDVEELKMLPPTVSPGYSFATSGVDDASDMTNNPASSTTGSDSLGTEDSYSDPLDDSSGY